MLSEFEHSLTTLEIVPSRGGVFEVEVDGELIFSKKQSGRHAKPGEVIGLMRARA
jgi:selenoprotein W-related protein